MAVAYTWCLFSARRDDLQMIYNAGFRGVRPNYPDDCPPNSPEYARTDNYLTARQYAEAARGIGFQKVVYEFNLRWMREVYGPDINAVKAEITRHVEEMSGLSGIHCHPYLDEPEGWAVDPNAPPAICGQTFPVYDTQLKAYYNELVRHVRDEALRFQKITYIATSIQDIVCCCDPLNQPCENIPLSCRQRWASYEFNNLVGHLMLTNYLTPSDMSKVMRATALNYSQHIQELINFYDVLYPPCRGACEVQQIVDHIRLNGGHSGGETWFYQGGKITTDAQQQWQKVLEAIAIVSGQPGQPV